ncbi:Serine/threonine-protein kinase HipA [bacterium YEK0313]|nr:Serine/threonine-protein kinase HipA [bacterium YEK0313]
MEDHLVLDIWLDGRSRPVAKLVRDRKQELHLHYDDRYLVEPGAYPLSLSLPLTDKRFGDVACRPFFDNLLQERSEALATVMAREGLSRGDVAGLLYHLGKDCAGAISVLPEGAPPVKSPGDLLSDYIPLSDGEISTIISSLRERHRLPDAAGDPSPLAGIQSKVALTLLPDDRLALPKPGSGAPTTHILKVPERQRPRDTHLEWAALLLSRDAGFKTARAEYFSGRGGDVLLIERFDRTHDAAGRIVRVHQEDFAQALGLPAELKYERRGKKGRRFDTQAIRTVLDRTANPGENRATFIRQTMFDLLIGNVDAHAKNHALLYDHGPKPSLAPRYDLLPTRLDPRLTDELAFRIGSASTIDTIAASDFDAFTTTFGISTKAARRRLRDNDIADLADRLADLLATLTRAGLKDFADLIAANMRILLPIIGLPVPSEASSRDAFIGRGGGWLQNS